MKPPLIIIGSAPCMTEDLRRLQMLIWPMEADYMAVGLSTVRAYSGPVRFIANNHPENNAEIRRIIAEIQAIAGGFPYEVIEPFEAPGADIVFSYSAPSGSSAITGALWAIHAGYEKIILAGCPLTGNAPGGNPYEEFRAGWEAKQYQVLDIVKSMSGWTKEFLGAPTEEWLQDDT